MLSRYDATQQSRVDCEFARKYDTTQQARVDCEFVRAYDESQGAWVDKLRQNFKVSVTDGFYDNTGNIVYCYGEIFQCQVKPTSSNIDMVATLKDDFVDPVISCDFTFGNSDLCPNIASNFRSHALIMWYIKGYKDGIEVASNVFAQGNSYAYTTIFDKSKTITLSGEFDELRFICRATTSSNYADIGRAYTSLKNITVDGNLYKGNTGINS